MIGDSPILAVECASDVMSPFSGPEKAARILGARVVNVSAAWRRLQRTSWSLGHALRQWGVRHYGSAWNAMLPGWDEWHLRRRMGKCAEPSIVHFIFAEFAAPKRAGPYHRKGARVVVSVHCSARRWDSVWLRPDGYAQADMVLLTSESQRPFVERHVPPDRVRTILHGVVCDYFAPPERRVRTDDRFRMFLLGNTERDHEFAARVAAKLPADKFEWRIRTMSPDKSFYAGIPCVNLLPRLSDAEMLDEYRQADVLAMPMLDSAANNVVLESMACGTPVMVNRVGGIPEYVDPACNFLMDDNRDADAWADKLLWLESHRDAAERMRPATRAWAEKFAWPAIAEDYRAAYRDVLERA